MSGFGLRYTWLGKFLWVGLAGYFVAGAGMACGQPPADATPAPQLGAFDKVWSTVQDRYWGEDFDHARWEQAREELRPRAAESADAQQTRAILEELISRLQLSHYAIIPGDIYGAFSQEEGAAGPWESGLRVRIVDGVARVVEVTETSDAYQQGVRPGWQLVTIGDREVSQFVAGLVDSLDRQSGYRPQTLAALMIESRLKGDEAEVLTVRFHDNDGAEQERKLKLHPPTGEPVKFGYLPEMVIAAESREVEEGIGYVWFNAFFAPTKVMRAISEAIEQADRGLIIDLRGNLGGLGAMTMGVGNRLIDEQDQYLGTQTMKGTQFRYVLNRGPRPYLGPVAVLVDECSISSAEILARGLQTIGRARVFGVTSAGAALPSVVVELPNGDYFQFAVADFVDSDGERIEGVGVIPDEEVPLTPQDLAAGVDRPLQAAVEWILSTSPARPSENQTP
ncbi:MAG: S41 family peptidase [Planctomycetota bacterium]